MLSASSTAAGSEWRISKGAFCFATSFSVPVLHDHIAQQKKVIRTTDLNFIERDYA
jgi:hypothetical protein